MAEQRRPAWLPVVAALFFTLLTLALGHWQWQRAEYKAGLQARFDLASAEAPLRLELRPIDAGALYFHRLRLHGRYDAAHQIYIDNRILAGRPGYHVITPLRFGQDGLLLVNRGWLAGGDRRLSPHAAVPSGEVWVEGIALPARQRYFELSAQTVNGAVWQNLDLERYRSLVGVALPDLLLLQVSASSDGLVRDWPRPDLGVERHRSYALQWFALSATLVGLTVYLRFRGPRAA
jgi:surfeit locus 1 family protein